MTKRTPQPGILADLPAAGRSQFFDVLPGVDPTEALLQLATLPLEDDLIIGIGAPLSRAVGAELPGLTVAPAYATAVASVPSTPSALWIWARGDDPGEAFHAARRASEWLAEVFEPMDQVDGFKYDEGRDLTGYVDGTENPIDDAAVAAAIRDDGSSFVAVQQWVHALDVFGDMSPQEQDLTIGRRLDDNEEIADAPSSAHVKRTAQESFALEAFMLRRSMPWADDSGEGLHFVAFVRELATFEAHMERMLGLHDGIGDALFRFTRPVSSAYFWCPPQAGDFLDLTRLGEPVHTL